MERKDREKCFEIYIAIDFFFFFKVPRHPEDELQRGRQKMKFRSCFFGGGFFQNDFKNHILLLLPRAGAFFLMALSLIDSSFQWRIGYNNDAVFTTAVLP